MDRECVEVSGVPIMTPHYGAMGFFATTESQAALVEMLRVLVETKENVGMVV